MSRKLTASEHHNRIFVRPTTYHKEYREPDWQIARLFEAGNELLLAKRLMERVGNPWEK